MANGRIVWFNGQQHRLNSVHPAIDSTVELDGKGEPWLKHVRWTLDFRLIKTSLADDLDAKITAIEAMYSQTGDSIKITDEAGAPTAHVINAGQSLGGVRVVKPPAYMKYSRGEHVSYRTGTVVVEATIPLFSSNYQIVEFTESYDGAPVVGPTFGHLQPNEGYAVRQRTRTHQAAMTVQAGRIVHAGAFGQIPPAIFPGAVKGPPKIKRGHPRRIGGGGSIAAAYVYFEQTYSYEFEWAGNLLGFPTKWN